MTKTKRRIYCPYCDFFCYTADDFVSHIEKKHFDYIPLDMTPWQFCYMLRTGKKEGKCVICGASTTWNENLHKYNRFCDKKACKDKYRDIFRNRMIGKYGKTTLLNDPEQQKKMLAARSISGTYLWRDHVHETTYTGSYERDFHQFLDVILQYDPEEIESPSPHTYYYKYDNKIHFYIPDLFIHPILAEIEIKDGGDNPNNHHKIQEVDKVKEKLKDEVMKTGEYNYVKIVNKENEKFLDFLELLKEESFNKIPKKVIML